MENFDVIAENVVGAIIKQACQGVEDRLGEHFSYKVLNIVKPWSKSWSQQAPKSNKSQIKRKKEGFGPWADSKITWATHPTHNF